MNEDEIDDEGGFILTLLIAVAMIAAAGVLAFYLAA